MTTRKRWNDGGAGGKVRREKCLLFALALAACDAGAFAELPNPVLFVTQVPVTEDFATIGSVFANHMASVRQAARGGDLWIRYTDGSLRNLTAEAGFGNAGFQGADAIAVRDPEVHFSGDKAIFSMVIGAPAAQFQQITRYWQLYEISGFGLGETVSITRVAGQPEDTNNVSPTYASDGGIVFVSDRSRNGDRHLYPQLDEYESTPTPSGLWRLDPTRTRLNLLQHSPSGSFDPLLDSFGRIVFTRWDHLQRDQQAENPGNQPFNWASESASAAVLPALEIFPEPRTDTASTFGLRMNHFFPWTLQQDGSGEETLNHIGRHELFPYFQRSFRGDPDLHDFVASIEPGPSNANRAENWLQLAEDAATPGRYYAIDAPEFHSHASGQIVSIDAAPELNAADMRVAYRTARSTRFVYSATPPADFSGHYRNPLPMSDGSLVAAWVAEPREAGNDGTFTHPVSRYRFRLHRLVTGSDGHLRTEPAGALTNGIEKSVSWWNPDTRITYDGPLWELSPVEVRQRPIPPATTEAAPALPEAQAFDLAEVEFEAFRDFLAARDLGVLVSRNVTTREARDRQQPYNLRVPGGVQSTANDGQLYDISYMQFLQGDQVRGLGANPNARRRVLAQPLHDEAALRFMPPPAAGTPTGAVPIASDGSIAAIVPARRAMTWQTTAADGTPAVRERYWISVQPGEVRACGGCHGVNRVDQGGQLPAENMPQALLDLLIWWRTHADSIFVSSFD